MLKVTFDSNVWRLVASPASFPNEKEITSFNAINAAVRAGKIQATLAETVFTLEAIQKNGRQAFFAGYKPKIETTESIWGSNEVGLSISIGPDTNAHPGNSHYLSKHWADAEPLGFKLLHCPRIAGAVNPDMKQEWFIPSSNGSANRFGQCGREIEANGAGLAHLKAIGTSYAAMGQPWHSGIAASPSSEEQSIAKAVAEWADGDAVAAHFAYGNDYLCTRDIAKSAGSRSVFSPANRLWLEQKYGVRFVSPAQLAVMI